MKKVLVATVVLAAFGASAFAAAVPVTKINAGETKISAEYSVSNKSANDSKRRNGFGISAQQGLSDKVGAQYSFNTVHRTGADINDHQLIGAYAVQVGASYGLRPDIDLNVYYQYDQYKMNETKNDVKGLHAGVGYSF